MERAGHVLTKLKLAEHGVTDERLACAAWPVAVGKTIARRTEAISLVRTRLVIQVGDKTWQQQLWALRTQILLGLEKALGKKVVTELEFRIGTPKRQAARAETLTGDAADEADAILDPCMRSIYVASRRKAIG